MFHQVPKTLSRSNISCVSSLLDFSSVCIDTLVDAGNDVTIIHCEHNADSVRSDRNQHQEKGAATERMERHSNGAVVCSSCSWSCYIMCN
jgi:hypothetical protein